MLEYRSVSDLYKATKRLLDKLPTDIDLVCGVPRCGMIPAVLIAEHWNLPLTDIFSLCERKIYPGLSKPPQSFDDIHKILIIDDSIASGKNLNRVKEMVVRAKLKPVYAVVYVNNETKHLVDYYAELVPSPRLWEWEVAKRWRFWDGCTDIDGVLCRDPTQEEKATPERLSKFYRTVNPRLRPPRLHTVITGRLERYRPETEAWFRKHKIKVGNLIMLPKPQDHGAWKAAVYKKQPNSLFFESSPNRAKVIEKTGKQVIVL